MISRILTELESLQEKDSEHILFGNFQSTRYHRLFPIRRKEDNVYFISWINQVLKRLREKMDSEDQILVDRITERGEQSIEKYRNRYGDKSYNFYRPKAWFPNGRFLSKFVQFQPTDDSDDSSIAMRGKHHERSYAEEIKKIYQHQSNGLRGRWIKRGPLPYRNYRFYNTWIGSEGLYVDLDLVVLCNILMFNAQYDLGVKEEDRASIELIIKSVKNHEHLNSKWSLSAWYPFDSVILYCLSDLISVGYYADLDELRGQLIGELRSLENTDSSNVDQLLISSALMKLGEQSKYEMDIENLEEFIVRNESFSFGVIPLLHPFNGRLAQYLSKYDLFRMYYRCDAHILSILLENNVLLESRIREEKRRAKSYKPDSVTH